MCQRDLITTARSEAALSRDLARDTLKPLSIRAARGVADLANPGREEHERHKAEGTFGLVSKRGEGHLSSDYVGKSARARQVLAVIARGQNDIARARRLSLDAPRLRTDSAR